MTDPAAILDLAQRLAHHAAHMPTCRHAATPHCTCGLDALLDDVRAAGIHVQDFTPTRPRPLTDAELLAQAEATVWRYAIKGDG